jgi:hypothetical protein
MFTLEKREVQLLDQKTQSKELPRRKGLHMLEGISQQ